MANPMFDLAFGAVAVLVASATVALTMVLDRKFLSWFRPM